jgi:2-haloalkanoic acid dehalogenase type II
MVLDRARALTFDVYGSLIDWETGIVEAVAPWLQRNGVTAGRRDILAAFAASEPARQQANPECRYPEILELVFADIAAHFGLSPTPDAAEAFGAAVTDWPAFADSAAALGVLARRYKLAVIANTDRASLAAAQRKLGVAFDVAVTAEDAGAYKPHLDPFRLAIDELSDQAVGFDAILHTAQSLYHDHAPAQRLGLATCWLDRANQADGGEWGATPPPAVWPVPDRRFTSLAAMAEAARAESWGR